ncbi:MAG TPA: hypothetical protein PKL48_00880 [Thermodesulfobacteriota bacterium]|nr:hypothetical protein [Deltaproteobacteria bacterium]HNU70249.1 hypothetical protein [Thermodesulfobacteriota bacterium]
MNTMIMTDVAWWVAVPAVIAVVLGATMYGARIRRRKKQQKSAGQSTDILTNNRSFDEVLTAMIKQTEENFQTVIEALHKEQEMLREYDIRRAGSLPEKGTVTRLADVSPKRKSHVHSKRRKRTDAERTDSSDRYAAHTAQLGRSRRTEKDSTKSYSPTQGELNLIADLQRIQQE